MPKVALYNQEGKQVGEIELSEAVFGLKANPGLLHQVVVMHLANQRQGTADTKTRAEVAGGGRKPWRQKGTGRARHGSIRSPLWRKGGVVFGPHPRDYGFAMPKKQRRLALRQALSSKVQSGELVVVEGIRLEEPKTRIVADLLKNLGAERKALIVTAEGDPVVVRSARNIAGVVTSRAQDLNVYNVLNAGKLVLTKEAVARVEEVLA